MNNANFNMKMPNRVILNSNILPQAKGMKSTFDLSENLKTTIDMDNLYPVYWEELNPGDHFEMSVASVCRLMPTVTPVMDNVKLKFFAFWVPNRLLWKNWTKFMGAKDWQEDTNDFLVPQLNMKVVENVSGGLADYLYCPPTGVKCDYKVSALPFRAYNKIWNDWMRSSQLQEPLVEFTDDEGVKNEQQQTESLASYKLLKKGKPLDYFTSCTPYPQAGDPVTIPLGGDAPVMYSWKSSKDPHPTNNGMIVPGYNSSGTPSVYWGQVNGSDVVFRTSSSEISDPVNTHLYADMSKVTGDMIPIKDTYILSTN